ncbi:MAG: phosphohistidine phosphatase SixA [Planctomycetes bacterium]|nr:phosphohistidine phosphatase SixA [Planctomycetota bacterium]
MRVYLIRHAIAIERESVDLFSDAARELTPDGIDKFRRCARALRSLGTVVDEVWTSPLVRARQTAEILAENLAPPPPVHVVKGLEPNGHFETILQALEARADNLDSVALVGHEPYLGGFTSYMLGGPRNLAISYKKGGAAMIKIDDFQPPLRGELCWLITPKQMGRMD